MSDVADPTLPDYYGLLQVHPLASPIVIKKAYRALMTTGAHPDTGGSNETAKLLSEAYLTLRDPDKRKAYDLALLMQRPEEWGAPVETITSVRPATTPSSGNYPRARRSWVVLGGNADNPRRGALAAILIFLTGSLCGFGVTILAQGFVLTSKRDPARSGNWPVDTGPAFHFGAGKAYLAAEHLDEAEQSFRRALALAPDEGRVWVELGRVLSRTHREDLALGAFKRAREQGIEDPNLFFLIGDTHLRLRHPDLAQDAYGHVLTLDPSHFQALVALGDLMVHRHRLASAQSLYRRALGMVPKDPTLLYKTGRVAADLGDRDGAVKYWRACVSYGGQIPQIRDRARRELARFGAWYDPLDGTNDPVRTTR